MCKLTEKVFEVEDCLNDAVVIQPKNGAQGADYANACAIIRRVDSADGAYWLFNNLIHADNKILTSTETKGNPGAVIRGAFYQLGYDISAYDLFNVAYTDVDFPHCLVPR